MLDLFADLKTAILHRRPIYIDNAIFRLHWLVTPTLLSSFAIILTARQYVGQPIDCLLETNLISSSMINTYCWISQTFLVSSAFSETIGVNVPHPGVDNSFYRKSKSIPVEHTNSITDDWIPERKYYPYYQWICFTFFIQAIIFYLPHYIWKQSESGLIKSLSMDLQVAIMSDEERMKRRKILSDYLFHHFQMYNSYVFKYFFCEFLCLLNVIVQIFGTNLFLDGEFISYGLNIIQNTLLFRETIGPMLGLHQILNQTIESTTSTNPFIFVFPRMTKCTFHYFGSSGDVQRKDALCLLPLNVFHEKIYLFLWFWFAILLLLSILLAIIRIFMIMVCKFRPHILKTRCRFCSFKYLQIICRRGNIGDFFLFYQLGKNLDPIIMQEVVYDVGKRLHRQETYLAFNGNETSRRGVPNSVTNSVDRGKSTKYHQI